jgi:hypothetical protein
LQELILFRTVKIIQKIEFSNSIKWQKELSDIRFENLYFIFIKTNYMTWKSILIIVSLALIYNLLSAQDYIVTWTNDTIQCKMVNDPKKEKIPGAKKARFGYQTIFAWLPNNKLSSFTANDLKGYYRSKRGPKYYPWLPGNYVSHYKPGIMGTEPGMKMRTSKDSVWAFLRRVVTGKYLHLYDFYETEMDGAIHEFYVVPANDTLHRAYRIVRKSDLQKYFADAPLTLQRLKSKRFRRKYKHMLALFMQYNYEKAGKINELPEKFRSK